MRLSFVAAALVAAALDVSGGGAGGAGGAGGGGGGRGAVERVTRVAVHKGTHAMELFDGERVMRSYRVAIGPGGTGPKRREGDEVTPVGHYHVVQRGRSKFTVFMLLDYPNAVDRARFVEAKSRGDLPPGATIGGSIGIHGSPPSAVWKPLHKTVDWTAGCVAVDDDEILEIAHLVKDGTPVDIDDR